MAFANIPRVKLFRWWLGGIALSLSLRAQDKEFEEYFVQPYYLYPKDQKHFPEYEKAVRECVKEIHEWYRKQCGSTFRLAPLKVIQSSETYDRMKFGERRPSGNPKDMPNWLDAVLKAIGGWKDRQVAWVFAQGGGGWAGGNLQDDFRGYAIFGDWVLEPISGKENPDGIPGRLATWEVKGGVPKGTTVHELGHGFGVHHPDKYEGKTLMKWHGDYPDVGFLPHEIMILRQSPFFTGKGPDPDAPYPSFATADTATAGAELVIPGRRFRDGDEVEFCFIEEGKDKSMSIRPKKVEESKIVVEVPRVGPGYFRVKRGDVASHGIPLNVYAEKK